jgi:hypothetical protein
MKRRADINTATELCRSSIPVYRRIGYTVVKDGTCLEPAVAETSGKPGRKTVVNEGLQS